MNNNKIHLHNQGRNIDHKSLYSCPFQDLCFSFICSGPILLTSPWTPMAMTIHHDPSLPCPYHQPTFPISTLKEKYSPLQCVPSSHTRHITSPKTLNLRTVKNFRASLTSPFLVTSPHFLYLHLPTISQIMSSACLSNRSLNSIISFTHYLPTAG